MDTTQTVQLSFSIWGAYGFSAFWTMMGFLFIGACIRKLFRYSRRDKKSKRTPQKSTLSFWFRDNLPDFALGFLTAFAVVRWPIVFVEPLLQQTFPNMPIDEGLLLGCVLAGVGIDKLTEMIAHFSGLKADKEKDANE